MSTVQKKHSQKQEFEFIRATLFPRWDKVWFCEVECRNLTEYTRRDNVSRSQQVY